MEPQSPQPPLPPECDDLDSPPPESSDDEYADNQEPYYDYSFDHPGDEDQDYYDYSINQPADEIKKAIERELMEEPEAYVADEDDEGVEEPTEGEDADEDDLNGEKENEGVEKPEAKRQRNTEKEKGEEADEDKGEKEKQESEEPEAKRQRTRSCFDDLCDGQDSFAVYFRSMAHDCDCSSVFTQVVNELTHRGHKVIGVEPSDIAHVYEVKNRCCMLLFNCNEERIHTCHNASKGAKDVLERMMIFDNASEGGKNIVEGMLSLM